MATYYWVGPSGSCSFVSTANWSTSRNGASGAGPPGTADTAWILDGDSTIDSGLTSANWATLHVGFAGTIGTTGQALVNQSATYGTLYYYGRGPSASIGGINRVYVWSTGGGTLTLSASNFGYTSGQGVQIGPGSNVVLTATCTNLGTEGFIVDGGSVEIQAGSSKVTFVDMHAGAIVTCNRELDAASVIGASTTLTYTASNTVGAIGVFGGATYNHNSSATITELIVYSGGRTVDGAGTGPFTVSQVTLYPKASYFVRRRNVITTTAEYHVCWP